MLFAFVGFVVGCHLAGFSFIAAGAGHGTYTVMGLFSSPLGLGQNALIALFGTPVVWSLIFGLLPGVRCRAGRVAFLSAILSHYAAIPVILGKGSQFGDWYYAEKHWWVVALAAWLYMLCQAALWTVFFVLARGSQAIQQ
jgi:hypothetical protein